MAFNPNDHLMDLKGKSYLQVMWRLVWFREEKPLWNIETKLERLEDNHAIFSAKIYDEAGIQKSSGYGSESVKDFKDFIEKAETKAVGRALAMLGYGTQFAPEMDEGDRIVDSPVLAEQLPTYQQTKYAGRDEREALYAAVGKDKAKYDALLKKHNVSKDKIPMDVYDKMYKEVWNIPQEEKLPWEE